MHLGLAVLLTLPALGFGGLFGAPAEGTGEPPVEVTASRVLLEVGPQGTTVRAQLGFEAAAASGFTWLIPLPEPLPADRIGFEDGALLDALDGATAPRFVFDWIDRMLIDPSDQVRGGPPEENEDAPPRERAGRGCGLGARVLQGCDKCDTGFGDLISLGTGEPVPIPATAERAAPVPLVGPRVAGVPEPFEAATPEEVEAWLALAGHGLDADDREALARVFEATGGTPGPRPFLGIRLSAPETTTSAREVGATETLVLRLSPAPADLRRAGHPRATGASPPAEIPLRLTAASAAERLPIVLWVLGAEGWGPERWAEAPLAFDDVRPEGDDIDYGRRLIEAVAPFAGQALVVESRGATSALSFEDEALGARVRAGGEVHTRLRGTVTPEEVVVDPGLVAVAGADEVDHVHEIHLERPPFPQERPAGAGAWLLPLALGGWPWRRSIRGRGERAG